MKTNQMTSFRGIATIGSFCLAAVLGAALLSPSMMVQASEGRIVPAPMQDETVGKGTETAIFAGGCFWGVQGVFQHVGGVISATSGYAGGAADTAKYETVSTGSTGHAEAVKIIYDPSKVTYGHLLQIYFSVVTDPTQLNQQGPDHGTQYRTAIFPTTAMQTTIAKAYIDQLQAAHVYGAPIVTRIESGKFYKAEAHHQDYLALHPTQAYIAVNDIPKVQDLKSMFPGDYRGQPVLVMN
ncbi:MAG: peptide-methionine (S)-S-oxide reductase MsrA [Paracoccaceae bacterium]